MAETVSYDAAMRRALDLAARGPVTGGNPQVGCVLLDASGTVVAEGWHHGAGTAHAEVDALSRVADARGLTAVVTLEPCNHTGRTGPCSEALIAAGVERVVYAVSDPGHESAGGAERLRSAGVEVIPGVLADEVTAFLHIWLTAVARHRPWVTVKWASTLDGRAAAADGTSRWITGTAARQRVHEQRAASDAILVGSGTVLADDPALTARGDGGELLPHQPLPVVVGERAVPADAALRHHPAGLLETGTRDLERVLAALDVRGIRRVYVEGGPTLASAIVAAGLADEYAVYLAPALLGGDRLAIGELGITTMAEARRLVITGVEQLGDDLLVTARPTEGN
ncbi:bifunctional diaminohydroxyphosphoribosylaminopyrimidine deaminase/5-amino-6-(5-phosphoribosylamino)uracil reductase RibD [Protaetiibacter intestinalis]|uniref:Riboflavin biosynthesis protein RibD n=1 Tax=Protaetiibacter intestinalis TaxID=2419774 RepID=A0A387B7F4_9MICO|nr:bifunctional diaminohydroxyphosphoribosylaminopyrimidine deaminase/5-amino-6-(5-phosphoribosylamino)uracil reductase RibD [Protaetiibacter intestinalis]AYF98287.1 bifunctional diaminohydroxyphosphoribosylaminopyrimidine deaminase/5-amino-6-(5-phosphoribosylamino)uracil reductase RibD [Protaetiibacter intestinalis]